MKLVGRGDPPAIGIVTPLYNASPFIVETVESVLAQLDARDRYVIIDDGSIDGSADLLEPYRDRLHLIRQSNAGEAAAVNVGIAAVERSIVGVVNADDLILPGLIDTVRGAFASTPELAAVYPDWRRIDAIGRTLSEHIAREFDFTVLLGEHLCIPGPGAFFRPALMPSEPVRDPRATGLSDYDFWLRFARVNRCIRRLPGVLAAWRSHEKGATITLANRHLARSRVHMVRRYLARPDLPPDARALRAQAMSAAYYNAALVGLRGPGVPAFLYAARSFATKLRWPSTVRRDQRRSLTKLLYASLQPVSGALHALCDPLLPPAYRRRAVITQTFGLVQAREQKN